MKKSALILVAALILSFYATAALSANKEARQPDIYVNGKIVEFADQTSYITDEGRTLVPARGVFEAMGSVVDWDADNYVVTISNINQKKEIIFKIGDTNMTVKSGDGETVEILDVPAKLMNNRTMIPLRAVSEALESIIVWNQDDYSVYISMAEKISIDLFPEISPGGGSTDEDEKDQNKESEINDEEKMTISLYTEAEDVKAGDEFEVFVKVENPVRDMNFVGLAMSF